MKELKKIEDKYPFIYEVDGYLYHIGYGTFETCTNPIAQQYFSDYQNELEKLGRSNIRDGKVHLDDARVLIELYQRIISYSEPTERRDLGQVRGETRKLIESLSDMQKKALLNQLQDYVAVWKYKSKSEI